MVADGKVPTPDAQQVVEVELHDQTTLRVHLAHSEQVMRKMLNTLVNIGFPCWVTIVAWSQSKLTVAWRRGECLYDELIPLQKAYFITDMEASHGNEMTKYEIYLLSVYDIVFQIFTHCGILLLECCIVFFILKAISDSKWPTSNRRHVIDFHRCIV